MLLAIRGVGRCLNDKPDEGGGAGAGAGDPGGKPDVGPLDAAYWRTEAKKAIAARDEAKKRAASFESQLTSLRSNSAVNAQTLIRAQLEASVARAGGVAQTAMEDVVEALGRRVRVGEDLGLQIIDEYGGLAVDDAGAPLSLDGLVGRHLSTRPHLRRAQLPTGSGVRPGAGGSGGAQSFDAARLDDPMYRAEWRKADPEGFAVAMKGWLKRLAAKPVK